MCYCKFLKHQASAAIQDQSHCVYAWKRVVNVVRGSTFAIDFYALDAILQETKNLQLRLLEVKGSSRMTYVLWVHGAADQSVTVLVTTC